MDVSQYLDIFIDETKEHLQNLNTHILELEQNKKNMDTIMKLLDSYEGALPFSDKASAEVITHETGMSKNEFKRAVGRLLKEGKITIGKDSIDQI